MVLLSTVLLLVIWAATAIAHFRQASKDAEVATAFAEAVALRHHSDGLEQGLIELPANEAVWNSKQPYAKSFARALDALPPGTYHFEVIGGSGRTDGFVVEDPDGKTVAKGLLPVDPLCAH